MPAHLLVVDDDPTSLKLACDVLESAGHTVQRANSGEEALASIARATPALLLLDLGLPGMDGLSVVRKLKTDPATRDVPIVAMTAHAMHGDEPRARAAGCDGYITKPIDTRKLPSQVSDLLAGRVAPRLKRILIADDVASSRKLLRVTLEAEGFVVMEAADGVEALAILERESIDAVIADILMPNMDGYRLCYEVRSSERWFKLPFIVYTNTYTSEGDEQVAKDLGADCYLRKPAAVRVIADALLEAERLAAERKPARIVWPQDLELLKSYSGRLIAKLEQRSAELSKKSEALEESNRLFSELAENIPQVFWMSSLGRREIVYVSRAYERIWGRSCQSLREQPSSWLEAVHPEDRSRAETAAHGGTSSGEYDEEYRIVRPDGSVRWVRDRAFPIRDASGTVYRLAGLAEDVTERKQIEQTAARLEDKLRHTQKLEALGTLAGGIAHDFNNILTAIVANAELTRTRLPQGHPAQENASEILNASRRAGDLVRQILGFSGRQGQPREPMRVQPMIAEVVKLLRATLPAGIELRTELPPEPVTVHANASQVHQVLVNLCSNAAHAIDERGRITIRLARATVKAGDARAKEGLRPGEYACLSVSDTGKGMDAATRERVFEPFFTTKGAEEGTGLGLSVVQGIVEEHGGAISVESQLGVGTRFDVYLPAAADAAAGEAIAAAVPRGHGERILFVDDEPAIVRLAVESLQELGYAATGFTHPVEALAAFEAQPDAFDLVITDFSMPSMSGVEVAGRLCRARAGIPIVLSTGFTKTLQLAHVRQLGVRELLMKPFTFERLAQTVQRALSPSGAAG